MGNAPEAGSGEIRPVADEQAALRRVATLVARAVPPAEVFAAVAQEVGRILGADRTFMARYNDDETTTIVAAWSPEGDTAPASYHGPLPEGGPAAVVRATGRPVRITPSPEHFLLTAQGVRSGVMAPVTVEGRLWGFMTVGSVTGQLPPGTETRLTDFTELVAAAVANADAREELRRVADEQAALRRVATLVARGATSAEVFAAVTDEVHQLLHADLTALFRHDHDGLWTFLVVRGAQTDALPVGIPQDIGEATPGLAEVVSGRAVRANAYRTRRTLLDKVIEAEHVSAWVTSPVVVMGRTWGAVSVISRQGPLPPGTEDRLAGFTELVATAVASAQAHTELRGFADEQEALRRVATLVAGGAPPEEVFAAVAGEAGQVLDVDFTFLSRYADGGVATIVGAWARAGVTQALPVGTRMDLGGRNVHTLVFQSRRPARINDYREASGVAAEITRALSGRSGVGVPVSVEGRLWGVMFAASRHQQPLPTDTEHRLAGFTELVATAVANAQARTESRGRAEEEAALRRVATLVARGVPPEEVFAAVTAEAGRLLGADMAVMSRFGADHAVTVVGAWTSTGAAPPAPVGSRGRLGGRNVSTLVFQTGRAARIDDYVHASTGTTEPVQEWGLQTVVGVPVTVEGRLWGVLSIASRQEQALPTADEARLVNFTGLAATAIANADAHAALTASRARIVAAADATRQRIERDLHDGAQQRLVSLALQLRSAQAALPPGARELSRRLDDVTDGLTSLGDELREYARGIHPAVLADGGLGPALKTLARRSPIPVDLDVRIPGRLPEPREVCAYYVVSEALTNVAKHSGASAVTVQVVATDDTLTVQVSDSGAGGASLDTGSGLVGLKDRVEALGGQFALHSKPGGGTSVRAQLPLARNRTPDSR